MLPHTASFNAFTVFWGIYLNTGLQLVSIWNVTKKKILVGCFFPACIMAASVQYISDLDFNQEPLILIKIKDACEIAH